MEIFQITFPTAGIQTYVFLPIIVALVISFFTSMAGVSGAFLLLPFQISILGFTTPSVGATNFLYNVVGTPGGIASYVKRRRILWPLIVCILSGAVPGVLIGYYLRVTLMPDPKTFKLFVGLVLLYVGWRLFLDLRHLSIDSKTKKKKADSYQVHHLSFRLKAIQFKFNGENIQFSGTVVLFLCLIVGIISGIYGIGGGAIIAPFLVTILHLPIYAVAGAVLSANFMTSLAGMIFYSTIPLHNGTTSPPDFLLGLLLGVGGLIGMYLGAKFQHRLPESPRGYHQINLANYCCLYFWELHLSVFLKQTIQTIDLMLNNYRIPVVQDNLLSFSCNILILAVYISMHHLLKGFGKRTPFKSSLFLPFSHHVPKSYVN